MSRLLLLLFCMPLFPHFLIAQQAYYIIEGHVYTDNHQPLPGASLYIESLGKGTVTDEMGHFRLSHLPQGEYEIKVSFLGFKTVTKHVELSANRILDIRLKPTTTSLDEVVVTDHYAEKRKKESAVNIEIVDEAFLKQNMGGSLMGSLNRLPGVSSIDIGSGQSKPVIRGLGFNRVVVVENGIKHEAQQWGADHGLEIDQFDVESVEVIKGPASLMYGSDAIGGVIDLNSLKTPSKESFGGSVNLPYKSNNQLYGSSLRLYGRKEHLFADARFTFLNYGDYKVPTDSVDIYSYRAALYKNHMRNTAGKERNTHLSVGYMNERFYQVFKFSNVYSKSGFFANAHGLEPRNIDAAFFDASSRDIDYPHQWSNHLKLLSTTRYSLDQVEYELNLGFQRNEREEWSQYVSHGYMPPVFPDTVDFNPNLERSFDKMVYTARFDIDYKLNESYQLQTGLNAEYQENSIDGRGFIIPAFDETALGAYAFLKRDFSEISSFQIGFRYDHARIQTQAYSDWFPSPKEATSTEYTEYLQRAEAVHRNFTNLTGSIGYVFNPEHWSFKINAGKSFRVPIAKELAANGVNYHRFSYEVGDAHLEPEVAYQLDANIAYESTDFSIGVSPFLNYFTNYIYLNPSSEHDQLYGNGNQIFNYTESEVLRYGAEAFTTVKPTQRLTLKAVGDFVYSEQMSGAKKGYTLPFSPPPSATFSIRYDFIKNTWLENAFVNLDYKIAGEQTNIVPPEKTTDAYQVFHLQLGGDIKWNEQRLALSLQVQNVFDTKYFNHTSYYRLINVPEQGRNIILNLRIPFSGTFN